LSTDTSFTPALARQRPARRRRSIRRLPGTVVKHAFFLAYSVAVVYPVIWVIISSFKNTLEIFASPWKLPQTLRWANYFRALVEAQLARYFLNSIFVTVVSLILVLIIGSMAAYVLARIPFRGQKFFYYFFISGLVFTVFLVLVPLFILLKDLHLFDSYFGLVLVYVAYNLALTIFILVGFFRTVPNELSEAARLDSCSEFGIYWRIIMPMAKSGLVTAAIFNALNLWNEFIFAMIILATSALRTLPVGLAAMMNRNQYRTDWPALFAGLVIVIIPTFIVYAIFQRQLTENVTAGALKG
jgi:N-acetylglucosamine transport system permease protein